MLQITLDLESELALEALASAKAKKQDIKEFLVEMVREGMAATERKAIHRPEQLRGLMSKKQRMDDAVERAIALKPGQEFRLQDLYDQDEWARMEGTTFFGRQFRQEVEKDKVAVHVRKNGANQAIYRRLEDKEPR